MTLASGERWHLGITRPGARWFMWGWRPKHTFTDTRFWRVGPVSVFVVDRR